MTRYLFIDESGDPGNGEGSSSDYYVELVLDISNEALHSFVTHTTNWRYITRTFHEIKRFPRNLGLKTFIDPLSQLMDHGYMSCSAVYLLKDNYTGPYLKPSSRKGEDPIRFRNFVHRQLLEHHFAGFPASEETIEIVFDRYDMPREDIVNLEDYLHGNFKLPRFKHISHVDSAYTEALQVTSRLVTRVKDIVLGDSGQEDVETLSFIRLKDISTA